MLFDECVVCRRFLPETSFRLTKSGRMVLCRVCEKKHKSDFLYPAKATIRGHGMTMDDYDRLIIKQNDRCMICTLPWWEIKKALFIDHNHACCPGATSCGKCVRGLLCSSCNYGLGVFRDNAGSLRNAAAYLEGAVGISITHAEIPSFVLDELEVRDEDVVVSVGNVDPKILGVPMQGSKLLKALGVSYSGSNPAQRLRTLSKKAESEGFVIEKVERLWVINTIKNPVKGEPVVYTSPDDELWQTDRELGL